MEIFPYSHSKALRIKSIHDCEMLTDESHMSTPEDRKIRRPLDPLVYRVLPKNLELDFQTHPRLYLSLISNENWSSKLLSQL